MSHGNLQKITASSSFDAIKEESGLAALVNKRRREKHIKACLNHSVSTNSMLQHQHHQQNSSFQNGTSTNQHQYHHQHRKIQSNGNSSRNATTNINNSNRRTIFSQNPFRKQDEMELLRRRTHNRRRWSHVFPEGEQEFKRHAGVNWNSLTQPAILPITSDFFPTEQELRDDFLFNHYVVTLDALDFTHYLSHKDLLHELVLQRLAQDYQIVDTEVVFKSKSKSKSNSKTLGPRTQKKAEIIASSKDHITLSMGHRITQITYNSNDNVIEVTHYLASFARNDFTSKNTINYNYELWSSSLGKFTSSTQKFTKYGSEFPWNSLDNLICGDPQKHLTEGTRYRRILFAIIPDVYNSPEETREYVEKFLKVSE